jgi:hypothetical protein
VGDVDDKILSNSLEFFEFRMFPLQFLEHSFQGLAGFVQLTFEQTEFVAAGAGEAGLEVAFGQFRRVLDDASEAAGDPPGEESSEENGG